jgi:hypothetical protein
LIEAQRFYKVIPLNIRVDYLEKGTGLVDLLKKEDVIPISRKTIPKSLKKKRAFRK